MCSYSIATKASEEGIATSGWIQKSQGKLQCQTCCLWHILSVLSAIHVLNFHLSFPPPPPLMPGKTKTAASKITVHSPCKVLIFKNVFPAPFPKMQIFKLHQTSSIIPKVWNYHKSKKTKNSSNLVPPQKIHVLKHPGVGQHHGTIQFPFAGRTSGFRAFRSQHRGGGCTDFDGTITSSRFLWLQFWSLV